MKMSFYNQHANKLSVPQTIDVNEDRRHFQTDPDVYFPQAIRNELLDDLVSILLPLRSFTYSKGDAGLVQIFIVSDELLKRLRSSI